MGTVYISTDSVICRSRSRVLKLKLPTKQSIHFKSVAFRPEVRLKEQLKDTHFKRAENKTHSKEHTTEDLEKLLTRYFQSHESINRQQFEQLSGFTRTTASRRLKALVEAGKLKNIGLHHFPVYKPTEGNFE